MRAQQKTGSSRQSIRTARRRPPRRSVIARSNGGFSPRVAARPSDEIESIYVVGLRNAHALEKEALQIMQRQVDRISNYPDVSKRLREHIRETKEQVERLDRIIKAHETGASAIKDAVTQMMGNAAALAHSIAGDEILKNAFANSAFEAYEIAAYKSLITMAMRQDDRKALPLLKRSLAEEQRMAKWADDNVAKLTVAYMQREEKGLKADR